MTSPAPFCRALLLTLASALLLLLAPARAHSAVCTPPVVNKVACENSLDGADPATWQIDGVGDETIQGFATSMSVNVGQTVQFKIKSNTSAYKINIYRLGYYGGDGARLIQGNILPTGTGSQPNCIDTPSTGLVDCANWSVSGSWAVPSTAVSGVYIAKLDKNNGSGSSHIVFVVRDDASTSDVVLQTSDATWQAYNTYGGNSLYDCVPVKCPAGFPKGYKAAYKVSYNRPFTIDGADGGKSWLFKGAEYSMIRFLEEQGYNVSYMSSADVGRRGNLLLNHDLFISSGHDEYWSASQRTAMENARNAGVNLAFFSGNTGFWKTRWEDGPGGGQDRVLVSYKDTHFNSLMDPVEFTGTWRDPRYTNPAPVPENALTGQSFLVNSGTSNITVPYEFGQLRLWRNTAAAALSPGGSLALAPATLGYEWDVDVDNGFRPKGTIRLSSSTVSGLEVFTDYGSVTKHGATATHHLTMYKAASGARVFNSGTIQWAWGLNDWNPDETPADPNMRQATVNLFADMGVQPATRAAGIAAATASADTTAPTSTINALSSSYADGTTVTISGTATDAGGGRVAGVEVSTDNGATWHTANGTPSNWTYSWVAHGTPSTTIRSRATDDSGNTETPGAGRTVDVTCPCSIFGTSTTPDTADSGDPTPIELGVKFKADQLGTITGVRFYKSAANTGTHVGSVWAADGTRLAQATFQSETASGWQTVTFSNPVVVQPNTTYVASYYAPNGHYAHTPDYFWQSPAPGPHGGSIADAGPLHLIRSTGNADQLSTSGVFSYGASSTFPVNSYNASNYWVDVRFTPMPVPGAVSNVAAAPGGFTSANLTWTPPSTGGLVTQYRITPYRNGTIAQTPIVINGDATTASATVTGLTTGTSYRFTVQALNANGSGPASALSNSVTPSGAVAPSRPTNAEARPASNMARVTWTASASDGDSAITGYTVTPYIGATAQPSTTVGPAATTATVTGLTNGTAYTFRVTATNGVGNSPASTASNAVTPQATIFDFKVPEIPERSDPLAVEVGVKWRPAVDGFVTGIRFYKGAGNTGTHIGNLWTAAGSRIGQATFTNESASGWQTVTFPSPVEVDAGVTYVASYFAPNGRYAVTTYGLQSAVVNGPLRALDNNSASGNGVYIYSAASAFPTNSYDASDYAVDVMFAVPAPGQVTGVAASPAGGNSANVTWTAPSTGGAVDSYRVTPYIGTTAQPAKIVTAPATSTTITGLTTGTTYTFRVQAVNANGAGTLSSASGSVTPTGPVAPMAPTDVTAIPGTMSARVSWTTPANGDSPITGYRITPYIGAAAQPVFVSDGTGTTATVTGLQEGTAYTFRVAAVNAIGTGAASAPSASVTPYTTVFDFAVPSLPDSGDATPVEVGMKFKPQHNGRIMGIRFYKSAANTGTHIGSLWTADGSRITQATFMNETATGWQTVTFASPVTVTAGTTYVASYYAPNGHYSRETGGLSAAIDHEGLTTVANSDSANGVYAYGGTSTFPTNSYGAANYWVDVLYSIPVPTVVTGVTATAGNASATVSWTAPSSGTVSSYEVTPYIGTTAQTPKVITGTPPATSTVVSGLTSGTTYTFKVRAIGPRGSGPASASSNAITVTGAVAPPAPTGVTAVADSKSAVVRWTAPAGNGGSALTGYTITPYIGATAQTPTTVGDSVTSTRITGLTNHTAYTFKVAATNAIGTGTESAATAAVTPRASILDLGTPANVDGGDGSSVVLGVKFNASVAGSITGLRFYKAAANTGTHVGALWYSGDDTPLATATFTDETASGWQTVTFAEPVPITAGVTYIASYLAPNGHYSTSPLAFWSTGITNGPLTALHNDTSANGVFSYSSTSVKPTGSYNATNYWVDVLFAPGAP